jgi:hypothetical protein
MVRQPHQHPKRAGVDPSHFPPVARDFPLIIQIDLAMVAQGTRGQIAARDDRGIDGPCAQGLARLEHEVPVDSIPVVLEQDKSRHAGITRERSSWSREPLIKDFQKKDRKATAPSVRIEMDRLGFISHSNRLELPGIDGATARRPPSLDLSLMRNGVSHWIRQN